ncbi:MAG: hypothetical protein BMS9Abin05_2511 [Rhodothermia bacterium]|nr:MAG: hypothetical protein BMS9Abin05_2511 [Rhodothermia bacterium]
MSTKRLNEQVKRNKDRFPVDFLFQLTLQEKEEVVANCDHLSNLKFSTALPYAFTEYGAIMVASVLNSTKAIEASVFVVRAFVKLRQVLSEYAEIAQRVSDIEKKLTGHDQEIAALIDSIKALLRPTPIPPSRQIGFHIPDS